MSNPNSSIHLVFSSHWDREWYLPFQRYRAKLVRLLDAVIVELESGRLPHYQMDGQFIPVEDYLEVRPDRKDRVARLIREGKLMVGPWYNLPDLFLVSGESLIRNFQMGMARTRKLGAVPSRAGWMCDLFGHNSQMPQILRQLGIDNAFLWRGADPALGKEFRWRGADGSELFVYRFSGHGYGDHAHAVRKAHLRDVEPAAEELADAAIEAIEKARKETSARTLLLFDGGDHQEFDPRMLEMVEVVNKRKGEAAIRVSTLDAFIGEAMNENSDGLKVAEGELRTPAQVALDAHLIPGVASSRIPIKRANHACETLLTLWLEPWAGVASACHGWETPAGAIELAWEYLLRNHPHDSICGCSPDFTHEDMPYRFAQARKIAETYLDEIFETVASNRMQDTVKEKELGLSLFAPAGGTQQTAVEAELKLPKDWPTFNEFFGFEPKPSMRIFDEDGNEVPYQLLSVTPSMTHFVVPKLKFPGGEQRMGARIALDAEIGPLENRNFVVRRAEGPTRISQMGSIGIAPNCLRNERLEVRVDSNGTVSLEDLETGRRWQNLLVLEDTADIGDGWFHGVALQDRAYLSTGGNVTFGLFENGPLLARMHVRVEWPVPAEFDFTAMRRSADLRPLVVEHVLTLRKGNRILEINTTIENTARDHRLRVLCPTGFREAKTYWADTPFDAVERPIGLREDNHLINELQVEMTSQQNWVAAFGGEIGLALIAPGQYESAVLDQPERPLALTLLRGFRKAVLTDGNEGGQIQGKHTICIALCPFAATEGQVPAADLQRQAQAIAAPVRGRYFDRLDIQQNAWRTAESGANAPKIDLGKSAVLTSCVRGDDGMWRVRIYNPTAQAAEVQLPDRFEWRLVDLTGEVRDSLAGNWKLGPKKIATLTAAPLTESRDGAHSQEKVMPK